MIKLLVAAAALVGSNESTPETASICQVAASPANYTSHEVIIRADFVTDGLERSVLSDSSCAGKKGIGVGPELEDGALDPVISLLNPLRITEKGRISASFQGKIVREIPNGFTFYNDDGFRFAVRRVTNVKVRQNVR